MEVVKVKKVKVAVLLMSKETIWGYVHLAEGYRLQDLVNDNRMFIPLDKLNEGKNPRQEYATTVINKQTIAQIEER